MRDPRYIFGVPARLAVADTTELEHVQKRLREQSSQLKHVPKQLREEKESHERTMMRLPEQRYLPEDADLRERSVNPAPVGEPGRTFTRPERNAWSEQLIGLFPERRRVMLQRASRNRIPPNPSFAHPAAQLHQRSERQTSDELRRGLFPAARRGMSSQCNWLLVVESLLCIPRGRLASRHRMHPVVSESDNGPQVAHYHSFDDHVREQGQRVVAGSYYCDGFIPIVLRL